MGKIIDSWIDALKGSVNLSLLGRFFLVNLAGLVVFAIIALVLIAIFWFALLQPLLAPVLQALATQNALNAVLPAAMQVFSNLVTNWAFYLGIVIVFAIVFFVFNALLDSVLNGVKINLANDSLDNRRTSIKESYDAARPRFFTFFILNIIVAVFFLVLWLLLMLPAILLILSSLDKLPGYILTYVTDTALGSLDSRLIGVMPDYLKAAETLNNINSAYDLGNILFSLIGLLLAPFSLLLRPVAFFEKESVTNSIKRVIHLGIKNYLTGLILCVLAVITIIVLTVGLVLVTILLLGLILLLLAFIVILLLLAFIAPPLIILLFIVLAVILALWALWLDIFSNMILVKFYKLAS